MDLKAIEQLGLTSKEPHPMSPSVVSRGGAPRGWTSTPGRARRGVGRPGAPERLEPRLLPAGLGYNVTLNSAFEAGTSYAGQVQVYEQLATFQASDNGQAVTNPTGFTARIDWGDGSTSTGSIVPYAGAAGLFEINGAHAYPNPSNGEYGIQVDLVDPAGGNWYGRGSIATVSPSGAQTPVLVGSVQYNQVFNGVATDIYGSSEYAADQVAADYEQYLGRMPSPAEVSAWTGILTSGVSTDVMVGDVVGSTEYFNDQGGTDVGWIDSAYRDLLDRSPSPAETTAWTNALKGGVSLDQAAADFTQSPEYFTVEVAKDYANILQRAPLAAEAGYWAGQLQQGMPAQVLKGRISASPEAFQNPRLAGGTTDGWIDFMYLGALQRAPDPAGMQGFQSIIDQVNGAWPIAPVYICDSQAELLTVDLNSGATQFIGLFPAGVMGDIAEDPNGGMVGVDQFGNLDAINPQTAATAFIGAVHTNIASSLTLNALEYRADGTLFAAGGDHIYIVNPSNAAAVEVGVGILGPHHSAGDIAFDPYGDLYITTSDGNLFEFSPTFASVRDVASGLPTDLSGLVYGPNGILYAMSISGQSITDVEINPQTGAASIVAGPAIQGNAASRVINVYGATVSPALADMLELAQPVPFSPGGVALSAPTTSTNTYFNAEDLARQVWTGYNKNFGPISIGQETLNGTPTSTYIVTIAGTQTSNLISVFNTLAISDTLAFLGQIDYYFNAIVGDIESYGVPAGANIILVGHSLGGMEAINIAWFQYRALHIDPSLQSSYPDARFYSYHFTDVVTYGSPMTGAARAPGVNYTAFTTVNDPVARLHMQPGSIAVADPNSDQPPPGAPVVNVVNQLINAHLDYPNMTSLQAYKWNGRTFATSGGGPITEIKIRYYNVFGIQL